jgi:phosphatidate cytidylyltransferase
MKRALTALAMIPLVTWAVLWADFRIFLALLAAVACLCYREYDQIAAGYGFGAPGVAGYGAGLLLLLWNEAWAPSWFPMVAMAVIALVLVLRMEDLAQSLPRAALLLMGIVYIFGCWKCAIPVHEDYQSRHWLMYALLLNWAGDIGAYYIGRPFGKHKLAPVVSPNKTWEGGIASVIASVLVAGAYLLHFVPGVTPVQAVGLTVAANIAGQLGDLAESALKRGAGVKDSGGILPGHGGFLDRVDSTLFALPVVYGYLKLVAR